MSGGSMDKIRGIRNGKVEDAIDTSRWWLVSPWSGCPCVNNNGDPVDLNSAQAEDDYKFYKELHLDSDTTENIGCGAIRYKQGAPVPMMSDCVVYGHNVRHGHWENTTHSETEAINIVRVEMTKRLNFGDAIPCNERRNDEKGK